MAMFKEVADIKTADMLNLPVPEAEYHNVSVEPSEMQKEMVASLAERAEKVRGGGVDSSVDNMLKITNDGRKLALDQRMLNAMLPDFENSKINACVDNVYRIDCVFLHSHYRYYVPLRLPPIRNTISPSLYAFFLPFGDG